MVFVDFERLYRYPAGRHNARVRRNQRSAHNVATPFRSTHPRKRTYEQPLCAKRCPWQARNPTSAWHPKADSTRKSRHVRNVPQKLTHAPQQGDLFNYFVRKHCIEVDTSIPSALAVFMLMVSSSLVGCSASSIPPQNHGRIITAAPRFHTARVKLRPRLAGVAWPFRLLQ